jgi:hypothetical protein
MKLVAGLPMPIEYPLDFRATPRSIPAGRDVVLEFRVLHPKTGKPVTHFETVHEKLFHLFLVSQDLEYFSHEHPVLGSDGWFRLKTRLPRPGTYRLLADFDPTGGTPQLSARTFSTEGWETPASQSIRIPAIDTAPKQAANLSVSLRLDPAAPLAGKKTILFFEISPTDGLEPFLGAWAHLLAVSHDLVDTIHTHPFLADGGAAMQFNLFLPRAAAYRIWLQAQRRSVVNTVSFTVKASEIA